MVHTPPADQSKVDSEVVTPEKVHIAVENLQSVKDGIALNLDKDLRSHAFSMDAASECQKMYAADLESTLIALQTENERASVKVLQDKSDKEKLSNIEGDWTPLENDMKLEVGDAIQLARKSASLNPEVDLPCGLNGIIRSIDDDGDLLVYFPEAPFHRIGEHWVKRTKGKMLINP